MKPKSNNIAHILPAKPVSKTAASTAKKEVLARLKNDKNNDASVGLSKNDNGDYVVIVKFAKKPTKKLIAALSKGLPVSIQVEVVEAAVALTKQAPSNLLVNMTQGILQAVKKVAKKAKKTKTGSKTIKK
jgi:hypothetical protein